MKPGTPASIRIAKPESVYEVFLPKDYVPTRSWPVVLALHPARTPPKAMIDWFKSGADEHGWIIVAPAARTQRWLDPDSEVILAALEDAKKRWQLDPDRICLAGYSSGAFMSSRWGFKEHHRWAAIFLHAGVQLFGDPSPAKKTPLMMSCGEDDSFLADMKTTRKELEDKGFSIRWKTYPGMEHHSTTAEVWKNAYAFFRDELGKPDVLLARTTRAREAERWRDAVMALEELRAGKPDRKMLRRAAKETKLLERTGGDLVKKAKKGWKREPEKTRRRLEELAAAFAGLEAGEKAKTALDEGGAD
ncbi:MAG: dienelactone hydrolase family protein [Planctomycetota bacterium]